jgi:acetyltransferase-like isoleucine patch superfamily enzyme
MLSWLRKFVRLRQLTVWQKRFSQHCNEVESGLSVQGPVVVFGGGYIKIGKNLIIRSRPHNQVEIFAGQNARLRIGNDSFINQGVRISCAHEITIGNHCLIADETVILDSDYHAVGTIPVKTSPVVIGDNVWLATRVIVLRGITIGEGSIVGAGSVVTRSIPPFSFAAGSPARVIRSLQS